MKVLAFFMLLENKIDPDSSMHKTLANLIISLSPPSKILCHSQSAAITMYCATSMARAGRDWTPLPVRQAC
jgi:hypothetical protein